MIQKFYISGKLPSLNEVTFANRSHWSKGASLKKQTEERISWVVKANNLKTVTQPVRLYFRWFEQNKRRDVDNVMSAQKFILDSLVKTKVLPNDNQHWVKAINHTVLHDSNNPRVEVVIEELTEKEVSEINLL